MTGLLLNDSRYTFTFTFGIISFRPKDMMLHKWYFINGADHPSTQILLLVVAQHMVYPVRGGDKKFCVRILNHYACGACYSNRDWFFIQQKLLPYKCPPGLLRSFCRALRLHNMFIAAHSVHFWEKWQTSCKEPSTIDCMVEQCVVTVYAVFWVWLRLIHAFQAIFRSWAQN